MSTEGRDGQDRDEEKRPPLISMRLTELTVCALPEDSINHHSYAVQVQWRGGERYAVVHHRFCLGVDGLWDFESIPSGREDDWIAEHRFTYAEAQRLACKVAPTIVVNGRSAAEMAEIIAASPGSTQ